MLRLKGLSMDQIEANFVSILSQVANARTMVVVNHEAESLRMSTSLRTIDNTASNKLAGYMLFALLTPYVVIILSLISALSRCKDMEKTGKGRWMG